MEFFTVMDDRRKHIEASFTVAMTIPADLVADANGKTSIQFSQVDPNFKMLRTEVYLPLEKAEKLIAECWDARKEVENRPGFDTSHVFWDLEDDFLVIHKIKVRFKAPKGLGFFGDEIFPEIPVQFKVPTKKNSIEAKIDYRSMLNLLELGYAIIFITG